MFYVVIAGLFDCVISVFAMFLYIYFGKNKNQYELFGIFFSMNKLINYVYTPGLRRNRRTPYSSKAGPPCIIRSGKISS